MLGFQEFKTFKFIYGVDLFPKVFSQLIIYFSNFQ